MYRRAVIRNAVAVAVTGLATTGNRVSVGRVHPEQLEDMPSLVVRTGPDTIEDDQVKAPFSGGPWPQHRSVEIVIEARVAGVDLEAQLDQIHLEVETALNADATLGGEVDFMTWTGSPAPELTDAGERQGAMRVCLFTAWYRVDARDPQALED